MSIVTGNEVLRMIDKMKGKYSIVLHKNRPNITDITIEGFTDILDMIGPKQRNKLLINKSINNVKDIFIIHDVDIPKFNHRHPFQNYKVPPGQEEVYEEFRINLISDLVEKSPELMDKIKIIELDYGVKRWIFSPQCEYVNKIHVQESDGIVKYQHYKHEVYMRVINDNNIPTIIFDYHKKALLYMEILYYIMIINTLDLDSDIKQYIKMFFDISDLKDLKFK